jgi:glycosyltransferase involved in cell wall biosynthesis
MSDLGGGTGDHVLSMMRHWDRAAWAPRVISEAPLTSRLVPEVPVDYIGTSRWWSRFPAAQLYRLARVAGCLRRHPADLVHTYFFWSLIYGRILKLAGRIPFLVENREDEGFSWGRAEYALLRRGRAVPDRVICVSEAVRRVVLEREGTDPARTVVVHNGVTLAGPTVTGPEARAELGYGPGDLVVGMVANLNRAVKGVQYFLDAVPLILKEVPSARFVVFGRGGEEAALKARTAELGIGDRVRFAGFRPDVQRFYPALDVSVLTSLTEGLSIALLESMNHGIPAVVTRVGGNPEVVVDGETGFLVPPRDPAPFAERVVALLRDRELRAQFGRAARRRVEERFDVRRAARRYLEIYDEVVGSSGRRERGSRA